MLTATTVSKMTIIKSISYARTKVLFFPIFCGLMRSKVYNISGDLHNKYHVAFITRLHLNSACENMTVLFLNRTRDFLLRKCKLFNKACSSYIPFTQLTLNIKISLQAEKTLHKQNNSIKKNLIRNLLVKKKLSYSHNLKRY